MKKLAVGVLLFALIAASVQVASAQPKVSGFVVQDITYEFGLEDDPATPDVDESLPYTFGRTTLRVNFSGDVSDNLSYYGRIQGTAGQPVKVKTDDAGNLTEDVTGAFSVTQANATLKNLGAEGLSLKLGRQYIGWTRLNSFDGFEDVTIDGLSFSYAPGAAGFDAYYQVTKPGDAQQIASNEKVGARLTYSSEMGGLNLDLAGKVASDFAANGFGYGLSGSLGLGDIGDVYTEWGKNPDDTDFLVAGANISALEAATGISAWVEYDVNASTYAFELSRELIEGITAYFDGGSDGYSLTAELYVPF
ncbi:hypothetical protein [Limnochorda pilosa]|uniref:hypothetical protein n=1 Tax=Limnochorda pilosa TaxID=1555112 RepID=UPI00118751C9|nr:hypothetical protein [Limnochorda pilosa]